MSKAAMYRSSIWRSNAHVDRSSTLPAALSVRLTLAVLLALLLIAPIGNLYALPDDRDQTMEIECESAEYREEEGLYICTGNAHLQQGSILLRADQLTLFSEAGQVNRLLAEGSAYYEQLPEIGADKVIARGGVIEYLLAEDIITLNQNASLTQEGATLNGNLITYDVRNHLLKANSLPGSTDDRIRVVLPPMNDNN